MCCKIFKGQEFFGYDVYVFANEFADIRMIIYHYFKKNEISFSAVSFNYEIMNERC